VAGEVVVSWLCNAARVMMAWLDSGGNAGQVGERGAAKLWGRRSKVRKLGSSFF